MEDVTFQATNLADVIDLVKGNGHDDRFSTNLRSWVSYGGTAKLFKQWKSRVCSTHKCVESAGIGEISAGLLDSFRSLSASCGVILSFLSLCEVSTKVSVEFGAAFRSVSGVC